MAALSSRISRRGQVTIPVEVRRMLQLEPNDEVEFAVENGEVRVRLRKPSLLDSFQAVPPLRHECPTEVTRIAAEEHALAVAREGR